MHDPEDRMHSAVGVLTSEDRDVWARWRKVLESDDRYASVSRSLLTDERPILRCG